MAYAPYHNDQLNGRARIVGAFNEKDHGHRFEFTERTEEERAAFAPDLPHNVFVGPYGAEEPRAARVLKTVVHIALDENADGSPEMFKWQIKNWVEYPVPA